MDDKRFQYFKEKHLLPGRGYTLSLLHYLEQSIINYLYECNSATTPSQIYEGLIKKAADIIIQANKSQNEVYRSPEYPFFTVYKADLKPKIVEEIKESLPAKKSDHIKAIAKKITSLDISLPSYDRIIYNLEKLEELGWVIARESKSKKRKGLISLTPIVRQELAEINKAKGSL